MRQKSLITYVSAKTNRDISASFSTASQNDVPFIGVSLNPKIRGEFCTSTVGSDIKIWNISSDR